MGFMGLDSWVASDGAADFRWVLIEALQRPGSEKVRTRHIRNVVDNELKDMANEFNTPGYINLALCLEVEGNEPIEGDQAVLGKFSQYLTLKQLDTADRLFLKNKDDWNSDFKRDLIRLHNAVTKLIKARRKR